VLIRQFGPDGIDDETLLYVVVRRICGDFTNISDQLHPRTSVVLDVDSSNKPSQLLLLVRLILIHSTLVYHTFPNLCSAGLLVVSSLGSAKKLIDLGKSNSCTKLSVLTNSPLSALHLDVLQNLLVSSAIPDGLLRATGPDIASLLAPQAGLSPVFLSSGFDSEAVKAKLEAAGIVIDTRTFSLYTSR
jgi:hypothetical protein